MSVLRFLRHTPCATLLAVQLLGIVLYPFMEPTGAGTPLLALFGLMVLAMTLRAVRATPAIFWVAGTLALPAVGLLLAQTVTGSEELGHWAAGFESALYFYAALALLRYMYADHLVTTDELFAIGAVFTLLAWAFAHLYAVMQAVDPEGFSQGHSGSLSWTELLFLSVTTLSATGISDIIPVGDSVRSVSMLEQMAGVFYIAMVVSRLVTMRSARAAAQEAQGTAVSGEQPGGTA
jgi:hypothetical protein